MEPLSLLAFLVVIRWWGWAAGRARASCVLQRGVALRNLPVVTQAHLHMPDDGTEVSTTHPLPVVGCPSVA
jgi:hypothetical protein